MKSGVYIGKQGDGNYDLVSTGDYINPITTTFRLKDLKTTVGFIKDLYLIIHDIDIEYIKVEVSGQLTFIRCYLSWDGEDWTKHIVSHEHINAIGNTLVKPFKFKVVCDDFLEYFSLSGETTYKQYKLKLIYV